MADDLEELRRRRKAQFRQREEERRQKSLKELGGLSPTIKATEKAGFKPPAASTILKRPHSDVELSTREDTPLKASIRSASRKSSIGAASCTKASPIASSVSFSQSPGVKRKRYLTYLDSDSSDGDDDSAFLAAARRIGLRRKSQSIQTGASDQTESNSASRSPGLKEQPKPPVSKPKAKRLSYLLDDGDTDDDQDILDTFRKLEAKRKQQASQATIGTPLSADSSSNAKKVQGSIMKEVQDHSSPRLADLTVKLWKKDQKQGDSAAEEKETSFLRKTVDGAADLKSRSVILPRIADEDKEALKTKPDFANPKFGPFEFEPLLLEVSDEEETLDCQVPASINRFLPDFQREGVRFLYKTILTRKGAILGDDMGIGKTVQVISLLSALLEKKGTGEDLIELQRRRKLVGAWSARVTIKKCEALRKGQIFRASPSDIAKELKLPHWAPVLIIVPPSIVPNWTGDFDTWGHFAVEVYEGAGRAKALNQIKQGSAEIMICKSSLFAMVEDFEEISCVRWKLVVVDEFHECKNPNAMVPKHLRQLRDDSNAIIVGLSGTLMQNKHDELWCLVDLVSTNYLGTFRQFQKRFARPIKLSRRKDAGPHEVELGQRRSRELSTRLYEIYLSRTKDQVLRDDLPMKDEHIVFCELSELQKQIYRHILSLPDFQHLLTYSRPCDCGINDKFFVELSMLPMEEKSEYIKRNKKFLVPRFKCCYKGPMNPENKKEVLPDAVLWLQNEKHQLYLECDKCPTCTLFPALGVLYKLSSHVALLQLTDSPDQYDEGSKKWLEKLDEVERAKVFLPETIRDQLPGGLYREASIMNDHFKLSGKLKVLDRLLRAIDARSGRVLLFCSSIQALDLVQNYVRSQGFSHLRLDGSIASRKRQDIVDEFKRDPNLFVFLLSTQAMGLGLNLTEANYVIIFDVAWNPAVDAQAQDRAYRIGQDKNVKVFRLVSQGTVEELKYLRQVYKTHLKNETMIDVGDQDRDESARLFKGVAGNKYRKGELFGLENLLKFKDGTFLEYTSDRPKESKQYGIEVHQMKNMLEKVEETSEDILAAIDDKENAYLDLSRWTEKSKMTHMSPHGWSRHGEDQLQIGDGVELERLKPEKFAKKDQDTLPVLPENHSHKSCDTVLVKEEGSSAVVEQSPKQKNGARREHAVPVAVPRNVGSGRSVCVQEKREEPAALEAAVSLQGSTMNQTEIEANGILIPDAGKSGFPASKAEDGSFSRVAVEEWKSLTGSMESFAACPSSVRSSFLQEARTMAFPSKMEANGLPTKLFDSPTSPVALKQDMEPATSNAADVFDGMIECGLRGDFSTRYYGSACLRRTTIVGIPIQQIRQRKTTFSVLDLALPSAKKKL